MKKKRLLFYVRYTKFRHLFIFDFLYLYNNFFFNISVSIYFLKKNYRKKKKLFYFLIFSFKKKINFVNLRGFKKENFFFMSSGFFIKFFEKKKSIKKNKIIKLLMMKCLRKLFILGKIKNIILIIRNNPLYFNEMLNFLNLPIVHKFESPYKNNKIIEEKKKKKPIFKILSLIFLNNISYSKNKIRKVGRIKRKILRKLVIENKLTD